MYRIIPKKDEKMLPFMKNKQEASFSGDDDTITRNHDDSYDTLDAVAEDLLAALGQKDKKMVKAALQALCEHIKDLDITQDEQTMEKE